MREIIINNYIEDSDGTVCLYTDLILKDTPINREFVRIEKMFQELLK